MDPTTIYGVIEFFTTNEAAQIEAAIAGLGDNLFNLIYNESFANNRGFLMIPFAKRMRSDPDDIDFVEGKLLELIRKFSFVSSFMVEVCVDSSDDGRCMIWMFYEDGKITGERHSYETTKMKEYSVKIDSQ